MTPFIALTRMTVADSIRQPLTYLMTALSILLLLLSYHFGMFNFESQDRLRMLATAGVAIVVLNSLFLGILGASTGVHDELASRTALTLFAKPIGRSNFLLGKSLGIWLTVVVSSLVVAAVHLGFLALALHTGFEDHSGHEDHVHDAGDLLVPWAATLAAHGLALAHSAIMVCLAAVLALRLPLIANILVCFAVFVLGHLLSGLHQMGAFIVPALALFNIDDTIQLQRQTCSATYFVFSLLYAVLYCTGILTLGLSLFKRQDIP